MGRSCDLLPSLSLRSGMLLSTSCTAGTTWSYRCSRGRQLCEKLPWCSSSQCSSSRHSLSKEAAGPRHHGAESSPPAGKHKLAKHAAAQPLSNAHA